MTTKHQTTDKELLELAAKAYGLVIDKWHEDENGVPVILYINERGGHSFWQPLLINKLTDCMGDALRLAVKLGMETSCDDEATHYAFAYARVRGTAEDYIFEPVVDDPCKALRRAIVRAASDSERVIP